MKIFAKPRYLCITEIFSGINFRQCNKGYHILCVIIHTGQNICMIKILPMRADGEISENFLLAKISMYTVHVCTLNTASYPFTCMCVTQVRRVAQNCVIILLEEEKGNRGKLVYMYIVLLQL